MNRQPNPRNSIKKSFAQQVDSQAGRGSLRCAARWLVFCGWFVGDWLSWQTPGALSPDLEDLL